MTAGDYFGEISFLFGCCHTATTKSERYTQTLRLNYKDYDQNLREREDNMEFFLMMNYHIDRYADHRVLELV